MKELRSFDRTDCSCRVELVHQGNRLRGYVENISVSGALLHLEKESGIAPGSVCLLRFHPAKEQSLPPWELWAEAIHCSFCLLLLLPDRRQVRGLRLPGRGHPDAPGAAFAGENRDRRGRP